MMLIGYFDETGHAKDERQRFVGVAGLVASATQWEVFERKWNLTLKEFNLPFFHMKDFATSKNIFAGWSELKRRKLYGKLIRTMAVTHPLPVGSVISLEDYRSLTDDERMLLQDPYYFGMFACVVYPLFLLENKSLDVKFAPVLSEQREFKSRAELIIGALMQDFELAERLISPIFQDMKVIVPLQAADIVAYELYKEFERQRYRSNDKPRYGYQELVKMSKRCTNLNHAHLDLLTFNSKATLVRFAEELRIGYQRHQLGEKLNRSANSSI